MLKQLRPSDAAGSELWEQHWREFADVRYDRAALKWDGILDIIDASIPRGAMLEAGCGLGKYLLYVQQQGGYAVGLDFATDALRRIREHRPGTPLVAADLHHLPFAASTFETILCFGVLEHFEQGAEEQARGLAALLRPGGSLVVTLPYANLLKRRRARRGGGDVVESGAPFPAGMRFYQHCFTRAEAHALVRAAGCEVVTDRGISRLFWLLGKRARRRGTAAARPSSITANNSNRGVVLRGLLRETAYLAQWAIPSDLTSHMIAVIGRKPALPADGTTTR